MVRGLTGNRGVSARLRRDHGARPRPDAVIGQRSVVMQDPHGPIHPFFDDDVRGPQAVVDLVELPAVGDGPIPPEHASGLHGEDPAHICVGRKGPMQIGRLRGCTAKRRLYCASQAGKNRLASASVAMPAKRISLISRSCRVLKSRSMRPLACGEWAGINSTPEVPQRPPKLTRGRHSRPVAPPRSAGRRVIGRMLVRIERERNAIALDVALEAVEGGHACLHTHRTGQTPGYSHHRCRPSTHSAGRAPPTNHDASHPVGPTPPRWGLSRPPRPMRPLPPLEMSRPPPLAATAAASPH